MNAYTKVGRDVLDCVSEMSSDNLELLRDDLLQGLRAIESAMVDAVNDALQHEVSPDVLTVLNLSEKQKLVRKLVKYRESCGLPSEAIPLPKRVRKSS
jgi:hypothetical protein